MDDVRKTELVQEIAAATNKSGSKWRHWKWIKKAFELAVKYGVLKV